MPGIGPKTAARLAEMGYTTLGALQKPAVAELQERFGERYGHDLHRRAHLHDESPLVTTRVAKSRSVETTFDVDVADHAELESICAASQSAWPRYCSAPRRAVEGSRSRSASMTGRP